MSNRIECPKCGAESGWFEKDAYDMWFRCLCGFRRVVLSSLEHLVPGEDPDEDTIALPKQGTKLWNCLVTLTAIGPANTVEIAAKLNQGRLIGLSISEVASQLTVLRYRRLVKSDVNRRGIAGGSTWTITDATKRLLDKVPV